MPQTMQNNVVSPMTQEIYHLLGQLNEHKIAIVLKFIKKQMADEPTPEVEKERLEKKRAAFTRLMELREEIAAANLPSIDEIRREAIEEKYGYMLSQKESGL